MPTRAVLAHLTDGDISVLVVGDGGMPEVVYWGGALGSAPIDPALFARPVVGGSLDIDAPIGIVAEPSRGWFGRPGIEVHRPGGRDAAPRFTTARREATDRRLEVDLVDDHARLALTIELTLGACGVVTVAATLRNDGDDALHIGALRVGMPVPERANELLTVGGRHALEFVQQRVAWERSCVTVENRHGKTSHERLGAVFAGTTGFGEHAGDVWACHIGWSGNYELVCDAVTDGRKVVQAGELLLPGEVELAAGESYDTPMVYFASSTDGLNAISNA